MYIKTLLCLLVCSQALTDEISYDGYKIYDINAKNIFEKEALLRLADNPAYDFFLLPRALGVPTRVMIQPQHQLAFETILETLGISYTVVNNNFGESIRLARMQNGFLRSAADSSARISFKVFHRFDTINAYLVELAQRYPNRVFLNHIGKSYEGRDLTTIRITNGDVRANKKVIFIDAGIHAREWIAPAAALYIISQLTENFEANTNLLNGTDWVILPVANPDGYEYTHTRSRMWRKTRKPGSTFCIGTDANRNFDFHWGEVGASNNPCADTFRGVTAFSEPEARAMRDALLFHRGSVKFYLTIHSYGNYLLYPWGYTSALPNTWREIEEVAQAGANAIRLATGTKYTVGSSTNVLYAAAGGSDDWAYARANIPIAITMELPGGGSGFDPSPAQIPSLVEESWIGIKAMAELVNQKY